MVAVGSASVELNFVALKCRAVDITCCLSARDNIKPMKVNVVVKPKEAILDPQGAAVRDAMRHLGMPEVRNVRIGKFMEIEVDGDTPELEEKLHGLCRDLLSNPVIEDYALRKAGVSDRMAEVGKTK